MSRDFNPFLSIETTLSIDICIYTDHSASYIQTILPLAFTQTVVWIIERLFSPGHQEVTCIFPPPCSNFFFFFNFSVLFRNEKYFVPFVTISICNIIIQSHTSIKTGRKKSWSLWWTKLTKVLTFDKLYCMTTSFFLGFFDLFIAVTSSATFSTHYSETKSI